MKYFSPSYWFKLWLLSAPLFNDETIGINPSSINNNEKIKNWASNNTNLQSINQNMTSNNYELYNLNDHQANKDIDPFYQTELETSTHKHRHEKSKRNKREKNGGSMIEFEGHFLGVDGKVLISLKPEMWEEISFLYFNNNQENFAKKFKDKMYTGVWKDWRVENVPEDVKKLGEVIYDNFSTIDNKFRNSSRRERIMIVIEKNKDVWTSNYSFAYKETNIRTDDSHYYSNKYIPDLISDFKTCINPVDNDKDETILKAIKSKNPSVDISQVYVKEKTINGKLDIGVKSNSNKYNINSSASCPNLQIKPDLISDFKTCINPVDNDKDETILKAIKSKNPSVDISQVYVKEKTINGKLDIGVKSNSNKYNINSSASCPNLQIKPDLISDFKTCINPVDNDKDETILKAIKSKNPSVDISQVYVKEKTINGKLDIGVKSNSNKYNINSSASCPNLQIKPDLISDFKTCINPVDNDKDETILKAIKSKNPSVDISQVYVKEKTINGKLDIGVKSNSNKYNINSSASCPNLQIKPDLISDFKTCINPVDNDKDETILKAIKSKNPSVDISQVYVKEKTINGKLDIGVKSNSNKYNINSSASCPNLQIKPETTTSRSQTIISISSSQHQNGYVSKSGYTLEELRNQKYNFDFQQAQINYQSNQNQNDYTNAQQRFVQAQNDYILHIQQGQPLSSSNQHNNRYITTPAITLMENDEQGIYSSGISDVIRVLVNNDIIREFNHGSSLNTMYYLNEDSSYQYLIIPIVVIQDNGQQNTAQIIELVLRRNDLYLDGFAINNSYYYFRDATIRTINNMNRNIDLTFDATYQSLRSGSDTTSISWNNIFQAFNDVINWHRDGGIIAGQNTATLRNNLSLIILATSESMRFQTVRTNISNTSTIRRSWDFYSDIITNWRRYTNNIIQNFRTNGNLANLGSIALLGGIHILLGRATLNEGIQNINNIVRSCFNNEYNHNQNLNIKNSNNNLYCIKIEEKEFFWTGFEYKNQIMHFVQGNSIFKKKLIYTFNLGKVNPIDNYNRLAFLGDLNSDYWGVRIKWGSLIYDGQDENRKPENTYNLKFYMEQLHSRNNKFHDLIKNWKVNDDISPEEAEQHAPYILQQIVDHGVLGIAAMNGKHSFGLTWYWENENYYLQFIFFQYLEWWASGSSLESWLKYGYGIKLYNDYSDRTKRSIFSDYANIIEKDTKKFQEKNELRNTTQWDKNINKWNSDFTKNINQEQHLPSMTNHTNDVSKNITFL